MNIILSPYNLFETTCVEINSVDYYNNISELNKNNSDISSHMRLKVEKNNVSINVYL